MDRSEKGRSPKYPGLASVLAAVTIAAGCAEIGHSQVPRFSRGASGASDCYRDDFGGKRAAIDTMNAQQLSDVATRCRSFASVLDRTQREIIYAYFYTGKALRLLAETGPSGYGAAPASSDMWKDAGAALEIVSAIPAPIPASAKPLPAEVQFLNTWVEAKLELTKVYSRQGRYPEAAQRAREVVSAFPSEADDRHVRAKYELAQVFMAQTPRDEEQAMDALRVFTQRSLDKNSKAPAARQQVYEIATKLGQDALKEGSPASLSRAQIQFGKAREAAEAANAVDPNSPTVPSISGTFVNLGRVNMLMAGVKGPDTAGGCESRTGDFDRLNGALEYFRQAGETAEALQWSGCASMALGNLDDAVGKFEKAVKVAAAPNASTMQVSLGRALYRRAQTQTGIDAQRSWSEATLAFDAAVTSLDRSDKASAARTLVEVGDFYLAFFDRLTTGDSRKPGLVAKAVKTFREARELAPSQPIAYARLGRIALGEDEFEPRRNLENGPDSARFNLEKARDLATQDLDTRANAHFLLSKLEVLRRVLGVVPPNDVARKKNADAAVTNADRAADIGSVERGQAYFAQACETRLIFGRTDADGVRYCVADEARDGLNYPRGLLFEGLYYLRKAKNARAAIERDTALENAYVAFDKGTRKLEEQGYSNSDLWAQLASGRGQALSCVGMTVVGGGFIKKVDPAQAEKAKQLFERYDVRICPVRR
ncbi:MAG: hypothetical protein ACOYM8_10035 [Caulobacterales bacterium]